MKKATHFSQFSCSKRTLRNFRQRKIALKERQSFLYLQCIIDHWQLPWRPDSLVLELCFDSSPQGLEVRWWFHCLYANIPQMVENVNIQMQVTKFFTKDFVCFTTVSCNGRKVKKYTIRILLIVCEFINARDSLSHEYLDLRWLNTSVCCVSWKTTTDGPSLSRGIFSFLEAVCSSALKCLLKAFAASPRNRNKSLWSLSALVRYMTTSEIASTFSSSLVRWFWLVVMPSKPSVSMIIASWMVSNAAQMPAVQDTWWADVLKISLPPKKVWLRVCDLPSPVLPNMETTLTSWPGSHPNFRMKSSSLVTWKSKFS